MSARLCWSRMSAPVLTAAALLSCGYNSSSWTPLLLTVDPNPVPTGATKIGVIGKRFAPGATVYWNGRAQPTTFSSDTLLEITLGAEATLTSGVATVVVANEGSYRSREMPVAIVDAPLLLASINPSAVALGSPDFTLTLSGAGFVPRSQVRWNDVDLQTQFLSSTELHARVTTDLVSVAGSALVAVVNPRCPFLQCDRGTTTSPVTCMVGLGPGVGVRTIAQGTTDIASDAAHALLYLSVPPNAPIHANSVLAFDPLSAQIVASISATGPGVLAVADDGQYLYAHLVDPLGSSTLTRYDLPGLTGPISWALAQRSSFFDDVQVAPGGPHTTAVSLDGSGVAILDDGAPRSASLPLITASLQWGLDATQLFALDESSTFYVLSVDSNGVAVRTKLSTPSLGQHTRIHYDPTSRRIYADSGLMVDDHGAGASTLAGAPFFHCAITPDGPSGKAFFACLERVDFTDLLTIRSFDLTTNARIALLVLELWPPGSRLEGPLRIVRWGSNGLAVATRGLSGEIGRIYLYSGPFVQ